MTAIHFLLLMAIVAIVAVGLLERQFRRRYPLLSAVRANGGGGSSYGGGCGSGGGCGGE